MKLKLLKYSLVIFLLIIFPLKIIGGDIENINIKNFNINKINLEILHLRISNKDKIQVPIPNFNIHARIGWWMKHSKVKLSRLFVKLNFKNT